VPCFSTMLRLCHSHETQRAAYGPRPGMKKGPALELEDRLAPVRGGEGAKKDALNLS